MDASARLDTVDTRSRRRRRRAAASRRRRARRVPPRGRRRVPGARRSRHLRPGLRRRLARQVHAPRRGAGVHAAGRHLRDRRSAAAGRTGPTATPTKVDALIADLERARAASPSVRLAVGLGRDAGRATGSDAAMTRGPRAPARSRLMRTALIVGAGIGGLAAGIALRRAGWRARVFERAAAPRELGFALNLAPNAVAGAARARRRRTHRGRGAPDARRRAAADRRAAAEAPGHRRRPRPSRRR